MSTSASPNDDEPIPEYTREEMNIPAVRTSLKTNLNKLELQAFEDWRLDFARWVFDRGKKPRRRVGYSPNSMQDIINRVERFCEWLYLGVKIETGEENGEVEWTNDGSFTTDFSAEQLDQYWYYLLTNGNRLDTNRRTINNAQLVLKYKGIDWEIPDSDDVYEDIAEEESDPNFTDWFTGQELKDIKAASLSLHVDLDRDALPKDEQDEWAAHLAQSLEKPKVELDDEDWDTASWKIPSLVYLSCDVGFRPCEIAAARVQWLDTANEQEAYLRIPREEDSKSGKRNRRCRISPEAANIMNYWLDERSNSDEYADTDAIWLNERGNPYCASTLRRSLMMKLQEAIGIHVENRENGWYMIRRGVGTDIINSGGSINLLMQQLRINRYETAQRYVRNADEAADDFFEKR